MEPEPEGREEETGAVAIAAGGGGCLEPSPEGQERDEGMGISRIATATAKKTVALSTAAGAMCVTKFLPLLGTPRPPLPSHRTTRAEKRIKSSPLWILSPSFSLQTEENGITHLSHATGLTQGGGGVTRAD
jgi:hypothetical protein